jgi:hypothetical protein
MGRKRYACRLCFHLSHKPGRCDTEDCFCPKQFVAPPTQISVGVFEKKIKGANLILDMSNVSLPDLSKDDRDFVLSLIQQFNQ